MTKKPESQSKNDRLAAALRANLRRRKNAPLPEDGDNRDKGEAAADSRNE